MSVPGARVIARFLTEESETMFGIDDAIGGALITGGANLIGSIFGSSTNAKQSQENTIMNIQAQENMQQEAQGFNAQQAQISRDYQTQMSNTAYQRARADMQAAGLNPILAAGASSSTPSGATASTSAPNVSNVASNRTAANPLAGIGDAVSKAVSTAVSMKTMDKMTEEIANLRTQEARTAAETATERERPEQVRAGTTLTRNESEKLAALYPQFRLAGTSAKDIEALPDWLRRSAIEGGFLGGKASDILAPILNSASGVRRLMPSRSTSERTDSRTGDSTFTERWDNLLR